MENQQQVLSRLQEWGIPYVLHRHAAAPTIEAALEVWQGLAGMLCKNIFIRNYKGTQHYLAVLGHEKIVDMRAIERKIGGGRVSFASAERMMKYLGVTPGSVSPFGLLNDTDSHVVVLLDKDISNFEQVNFHPNDNTATLTLNTPDFMRFLEKVGNRVEYWEFAD